MDAAVKAAIPEDAWTPIKYPRAIWDDQLQAWVSDAEVAETGYTAFASRKGQAITARLIVRWVRDLKARWLYMPSGSFAANAAWLTCAAITHNLIRAAGCLASRFHAKARGATIRANLIDVAARLAHRGRGQPGPAHAATLAS